MWHTLTAVSGNMRQHLPKPRKVRGGVHCGVKEALRLIQHHRTDGQLRVDSSNRERFARIDYAGFGSVEVAYYKRGADCYWVVRRDTIKLNEKLDVQNTTVYPPFPYSGTMREPTLAFVGVPA